METYIAYAVTTLLILHVSGMFIASTMISNKEPRKYEPSKIGVVFLLLIIGAGFYKFNDIIFFLALAPFGGDINQIVQSEIEIFLTAAFFQTGAFVSYISARLGREDRWEAKKFKEIEAIAQSQSIETLKQKEETNFLKARSEGLQKELEDLKAANKRLDGHYNQLLTKNRELQEDMSFLESNASPQTIEALENRRAERKIPIIFDS